MRRSILRVTGFACASLAFLLSSCGEDPAAPGGGDPGPDPVVALRVLADSLGPRTQSLLVTRQGEPVWDAVVTVNGTAIPHVGDGRYRGELPAEVAPGGTVELAVSAGGASAQGAGIVPDLAVIISPANGDVLADTTALRVRWSSATSPDRFEMVATWSEGDSVASRSYAVAGNTRELSVPAREVPPETDVAVRVLAYNDSWITGSVDALSKLTVGGVEAPGPVFRRQAVPVQVGATLWPGGVTVYLLQAGTPVDGATVTVNGSRLNSTASGTYQRELAGPLPPGSEIRLRVQTDHATVDGVGTVPETPAITAPVPGSVFALADSIPVAWTAAPGASGFQVSAYNTEASCPDLFSCGLWSSWTVEGAERELTVAAAEIGTDDPIVVEVFSIERGAFTGPAEAGSELAVLSPSTTATIAIVP